MARLHGRQRDLVLAAIGSRGDHHDFVRSSNPRTLFFAPDVGVLSNAKGDDDIHNGPHVLMHHNLTPTMHLVAYASAVRASQIPNSLRSHFRQFYGQMLFWGTGNEGPYVAIVAWFIDFLIVTISEVSVIAVFARALRIPVELEDEKPAPKLEDGTPKFPRWKLVMRQTVSERRLSA
eukprot:5722480-Prymnesium_polylepis.1